MENIVVCYPEINLGYYEVKRMGLDQPKQIFMFVLGIIVAIFGALPIVNTFAKLPIPGFLMLTGTILIWAIAIFSVVLIIMSFLCQEETVMWVLIGTGLVFGAISIVTAINVYQVPIFATNQVVGQVMLFLIGIGFIADGFGNK
jgi:hypothetical protein